MQNLLAPLTGRCPTLRMLTIRKVGQKRRTAFTPESSAKDEDIYHEIATFVNSVRGTLRRIAFEQGERIARPPPPIAGRIATVGPPPPPIPDQGVTMAP